LKFQNYSRVFDVMPNNFRWAHRRSDYCTFCPLHIEEKAENGLTQFLTKNFNDTQTELGNFFTPRATWLGLRVFITKRINA